MAMIPYNAGFLRCNPLWSQLQGYDLDCNSIKMDSHKNLTWKCSVCDKTFVAAPRNRRHASGRCSSHTNTISCAAKRRRYYGLIPISIQTILRAAVLQGVSVDTLFAANISILACYERAEVEMHMKEMASISKVDLLDNGFWWQDSLQRANGERVKRKREKTKKESISKQTKNDNKKRKQRTSTNEYQNNIVSMTLSQGMLFCCVLYYLNFTLLVNRNCQGHRRRKTN